MVKTVFKRFLLSLFIIGIGLWWVGSGKGLAVIRALESQTSYGLYVRLLAQDLLELRHELTIGVALNETTQTVSLKLSAEDISAFRETYSKSLPEGYLRDLTVVVFNDLNLNTSIFFALQHTLRASSSPAAGVVHFIIVLYIYVSLSPLLSSTT